MSDKNSPANVQGIPISEVSKLSREYEEYQKKMIELFGMDFITQSFLNTISSEITYPQAKSLSRQLESKVAATISSADDYVPPQRFEAEWGVDGMVAIISKSMSPEKAYEYIAQKHDKPLELVDSLSSKDFYVQKEILDVIDTHPDTKTKVNKLKRKRLYRKNTLAKLATPNELFNNTYDNMLLWAEIDSMKKEIKELRKLQEETNVRVTALENKVTPSVLSKADKKGIAKEMYYQEGAKQKVIASTLGVSLRTVKYWLAEDESADK